jgi:hypothetical protein
MTGTTIDHLVALTVFLAAILLFIGLFNQTIQTATLYQRHQYLANKCSDILDNILLSPGIPFDWGQSGANPTGFGIQDPEFTQYRLSPFSLMRLDSSLGTPMFYSKTGLTYSNTTTGFGKSEFVPYSQIVTTKTAAGLMGTNGSYGFSLTVAPTMNVSISETRRNPLRVNVTVTGASYPFAYSAISYCLIRNSGTGSSYPSYTTAYGNLTSDSQGSASLDLGAFDDSRESYALIVCAHANGLVGVGCYEQSRYTDCYALPLISDFNSGTILIAHSSDVTNGSSSSAIAYNATFFLLTEDFTFREMLLENSSERTGKVNPGPGQPYGMMTIDTNNPGILVLSYMKQSSATDSGIVLMPWGISSMAFSVTFGDNPHNQEWVATDIRQVTVSNVAYQAKLLLWSLEGYSVVS